MATYSYTVEGTGRGGQTWGVSGDIQTERMGEYPLMVQRVIGEAFARLTEGKAEYGDLTTCQGPYTIQRLVIELQK